MKTSNLVCAAMAALSLASCSKSDPVSVDPSGESGGTKTQAKIVLTQSTSGTYAPAGAATPTAAEQRIESATVYVFNGGQMLEKIVPLTVDGSNTGAEEVFEITTGAHYFYAAVNIPASQLSGITAGSTSVYDFERKLIALTNTEDLTTNGAQGFWMTNVTKPTAVNLVDATQAEATSNTKNHVVIGVGRAVAKVAVDFVPQSQTGGVLTQVKYKVRNNPNRMYLMPVYESSVLVTPYFSQSTVSTGNYFSNGTYLQTGDAVTPCTNPSYAIENTNSVPKEGNATLVSIQGVFTPATVYDEDGANGRAGVENETFYRILKSDGLYTEKYYFEEPTAAEIAAETTSDAGAGYVEYPQGVCYYGLWLGKPGVTDLTAKYSVARNTYYWLTINAMSGAGESDEDKVIVDPEIPLEKETWMKAEIEVLPWTLVDMSSGI